MVASRMKHPTNDITSIVANGKVNGEPIPQFEMLSYYFLLVVAGNETTRNAIAHGLWLLTEFGGERARLAEDFEDRIGGAVEEVVRYAAPVIFMRRTLTRDYTMGGHDYAAGDKAVLFYWAANRDESVFADPARFDITRQPNPHLGFGGPGPHFCLGAHLARREITVMLRELLRSVPDIRAAAEPDRLLSAFINGIKRMPCEFSTVR
jgi:cytochrome P450